MAVVVTLIVVQGLVWDCSKLRPREESLLHHSRFGKVEM